MAILDGLLAGLTDTGVLKDFLSGKTSPTVKGEVSATPETLKNVAFYLFLALGGFAIVLAFLLFWAMYMALKLTKR